jgi:D-glycero-alpha-D-manno-heptose-7-phosphate kinase
LQRGELNSIGDLLHFSWEQKKRLAHGISNPRIDELYNLARHLGARGGKLTGAGGGGFLMLYVEPEYQKEVTEGLENAGLFRMDYRFEGGGATVLMNTFARPVNGQLLNLYGRADVD